MDGKTIKLVIWDSPTQRLKNTLIPSYYYKTMHGIIVIYDITNRDSFGSVQRYMAEIEKYASELA